MAIRTTTCELFRRCLNDDRSPEEWRELTRRLSPRLRGLVRRNLLGIGTWMAEDETEDVLQELYCRLLSGAGRAFRGGTEGELWEYLSQMVRTQVLDLLRAWKTEKRRIDRRALPLSQQGRWGRAAALGQIADPEEACLAREGLLLLERRCRRVARGEPARARALRLALLEGYSSRDIARALEGRLSPGQVDGLVHRLRRQMAREGLELPRRPPGCRPGWLPAAPIEKTVC